jgi:hypothetical protein
MNNLYFDLAQFSGTEQYHKLGINPHVVGTDGVAYLCKQAKCYWLFDLIASHLESVKKCVSKHGQDFANWHLWTLTKQGKGAIIQARMDTHAPVRITQKIEHTDFPFDETGAFKLFVVPQDLGNKIVFVIMLPNEY